MSLLLFFDKSERFDTYKELKIVNIGRINDIVNLPDNLQPNKLF